MNWQTIQRHLGIQSDGIPGTHTAIQIAKALNIPQHDWQSIQKAAGCAADGKPGANTAQAIAQKLGIPEEKTHSPSKWPAQSEIRSNKSLFGSPGHESNLTSILLPYPMKIAWETSSITKKMSCHKLIAEPVRRIFEQTLQYYGETRIAQLGLDLYGGCFNDRSIRAGTTKSMHAWGIAIDLDPDHNGLNTHAPKARFSGREYVPFWEIVEHEGGVSLGRERDCDWMHFQFARLG